MFTLREILKGTEVGEIQSCGVMQVIPLIIKEKELEDKRFITPFDNKVKFRTVDYGTMSFQNHSDNPCIVPMHTSFLDKKRNAQDHSMTKAGIVDKNIEVTYNDAVCVQQTQGGHVREWLSSEEDKRFSILPYSLKEKALNNKGRSDFKRMWDDIMHFNQKLGIRSMHGHLEYFYDGFSEELDNFVAEFELVPNQIGAIVLINGEVVGIEVAPNTEYWKKMWEPLIRDSYGSIAIETRKKEKSMKPDTRLTLTSDDCNSVQDVLEKFDKIKEEETERTKNVVRDILDINLDNVDSENLESFSVTTLSSEKFYGQVVNEGKRVHYASLFTRVTWSSNKKYFEQESFGI